MAATAAHTQTPVGGIIDSDVRWDAEGGPYLVNRDILVTPAGRLSIMPGTRVIIGRPVVYDDIIEQVDGLDSQMISIKVQGMIRCVGRMQNRIVISSLFETVRQSAWYGIIIQNTVDESNEIAFTDIAGASNALTVRNAKLTVRNTLFEFNNTGLRLENGGNATILNCILSRNFAAGAVIRASNPRLINTIFAFNDNIGIWCDGISQITARYNCFFGNADGDFLDCDPKLGVLTYDKKKHTDSTDMYHNQFRNPHFVATTAASRSPTEPSEGEPQDSTTSTTIAPRDRYRLSADSPCKDSGDPDKTYRDLDGSRADMGIFGSQEFVNLSD